jgi:ATP-dependent Lon protease
MTLALSRPWLSVAVGLALASPGTTLFAQAAAGPTPQIYTCTDADGRNLTSDRPIPACNDRVQTILNPSGTVKARIGPVLTPYEQSQSEARIRAEQKERARLDEEKRMERALLVRYPNLAAHQKDREESLAQTLLVRQVGATRMKDLLAERSKLTEEMAFYAKDPSKAPTKLQRQIASVTQSLAEQERFLADKDKEVQRINARFDEEQKRLEPLWLANQASAATDPTR